MATREILLDVGGSFVKCSDGRSVPINSNGSREEIASALRAAMGDASGAGVAIPGPFDYDNGVFLMKHKFAAVYGESFADLVKPGANFRFIHDVNAMLLGEMSAGRGADYQRVALVTLGTGLGFSMCIDSVILCDESGAPRVSIYNLPYGDGVLEDYASKRGIVAAYGLESGAPAVNLTAKKIAGKAFAGDDAANLAFLRVGRILAGSVAPILDEYGIECLLFGGQISRSFELFRPSLEDAFRDLESLRYFGPVSDIDQATFNGLRTLQAKTQLLPQTISKQVLI